MSDLEPSECEGSPYDTGFTEAMTAESENTAIQVTGDPLHFRCAQQVEGFYQWVDGEVHVLVQPEDMDPSMVAGCDCAYTVRMTVPEAPPATVRLFRRWDDLNDDNDPVEIGTAEVP